MKGFRYVHDDDGERIELTGFGCGIDDENPTVHNADGFASTDVYIQGGHFTWEGLETLKLAITEAEKRWRGA